MIISRTPYRVSLLGGGTDYPAWYRENPGAVLGGSINKYCWLTLRRLPPFFEHRQRIVYSAIEEVREVEEIRHPAVRETLKFMGIADGLEVHHDGDLPARSGMGTSSSFTVGLLHALYALKGVMPTRMRLAREAIHIERDLMRENVGSQDQVLAALGGLNRVDFGPVGPGGLLLFLGDPDTVIQVQPITIPRNRLEELQSHLMLLFTGVTRTASHIAAEQVNATPSRQSQLQQMYQMVGQGVEILSGSSDISEFGRLLHEAWELKRSLTDKVSPLYVDYVYETALKEGATGGKLLGAGGGGFILLFVQPDLQARVREKLRLLHVPFRFEAEGTRIVHYQEGEEYG